MSGSEGKRAVGKMVAGSKPGRRKTSRTGAAKKKLEEVKEEVHDLSENEDELRSMFAEWAKKYNKVYNSKKKRELRFSIFLFAMRGKNNIDGLNESADRTLSERGYGNIGGLEKPSRRQTLKLELPDFEPTMSKQMSREELEEGRIEFEKWVVWRGKVYANEDERRKRLMIFLKNKSETEEFLKQQVGKLWKQRFAFDEDKDMDKVWGECPPKGRKYKV